MNPTKKVFLQHNKNEELFIEGLPVPTVPPIDNHEDQPPPIEKKQRKRRTLNETSKRDFVCGCGKSYVSYPAIYLHVQRKHDSQWPPNTKLPQKSEAQDQVKRGRPKKEKRVVEEDQNIAEENFGPKPEDKFWVFLGNKGNFGSQKAENKYIKPIEAPSMDIKTILNLKNFFSDPKFHNEIFRLIETCNAENDKGNESITSNDNFIEYDKKLAQLLGWIGETLREDAFVEITIILLLVRIVIFCSIWYDLNQKNVGLVDEYLIIHLNGKNQEFRLVPDDAMKIGSLLEMKLAPFLCSKWTEFKKTYDGTFMVSLSENLKKVPKEELDKAFSEKLKLFIEPEAPALGKLAEIILFLRHTELEEKLGSKTFNFLSMNSFEDLKQVLQLLLEWLAVFDENDYAFPELNLDIV